MYVYMYVSIYIYTHTFILLYIYIYIYVYTLLPRSSAFLYLAFTSVMQSCCRFRNTMPTSN